MVLVSQVGYWIKDGQVTQVDPMRLTLKQLVDLLQNRSFLLDSNGRLAGSHLC